MIGEKLSRLIGEYTTNQKGPLLVVSAGVHGNEPSGVIALQQVFKILNEKKPNVKGEIIGISGNLKALKAGQRYIEEDLNRTWTKENVQKNIKDTSEKREMFEIINLLETYRDKDFTDFHFIDCHTTSSNSLPYISVQEVSDNDAYAHKFPTHIIRGFSDIVSGCIDHYLSRTNVTGFVFEGGQHKSKDAIKHHEGMIWLSLKYACGLDFNTLENIPDSVNFINQYKSQQKTFEIIYRHGLEDDDDFKMAPNYENFQSIKKDELLAYHNGKPVKSDYNAYIFMPLYQAQGNDGFFVVQEV